MKASADIRSVFTNLGEAQPDFSELMEKLGESLTYIEIRQHTGSGLMLGQRSASGKAAQLYFRIKLKGGGTLCTNSVRNFQNCVNALEYFFRHGKPSPRFKWFPWNDLRFDHEPQVESHRSLDTPHYKSGFSRTFLTLIGIICLGIIGWAVYDDTIVQPAQREAEKESAEQEREREWKAKGQRELEEQMRKPVHAAQQREKQRREKARVEVSLMLMNLGEIDKGVNSYEKKRAFEALVDKRVREMEQEELEKR